jgi:hypothetical protein
MDSPDLTKYQERLIEIVDSALSAYEKQHDEPASLRKLAASIGRPKSFNTLYAWQNKPLRRPIKSDSYSLLSAIDTEGRNTVQLAAYLLGVDVEQLPEETVSDLAVALFRENVELKKRVGQMYQLATA